MLEKTRLRIIFFLPALLWCLTILYFSLLPSDLVPDRLQKMDDKFIHAGIYFVFTLLLFLPFSRFINGYPVGKNTLLRILLAAVLFGGILELIQEFAVSGRAGDWFDFLANVSGALLAALLFSLGRQRAA